MRSTRILKKIIQQIIDKYLNIARKSDTLHTEIKIGMTACSKK